LLRLVLMNPKIASLVSFQGGLNVPAYAAAKGGVAQLTKALSNSWAAHGINVNAVSVLAEQFRQQTDQRDRLLRDISILI
jgi:2-deoxy-D-gluconate 3-dehydrogenase